MVSRPMSVSVVAWILLAFGALGAMGVALMLVPRSAAVTESMATSPIPIPIQYAMSIAGTAMELVSGYFILRGKNWARVLYVVWSATGFLISFLTSPVTIMLVPSVAIFLAITFFLFRPAANAFFASDGRNIDPRSLPSTRRLVGVLFYILAGFWFTCTGFAALMSFDAGIVKMIMICVFLLPFAICLSIGRWLSSGHQWKRDVGIVFIVSTFTGAMMSVMMAGVFANPEFNKKMRPEHADFFHDYLFAAVWFGAWLLLGGALVLMSRSSTEQPNIPRPVAR
jgi:hypothetical protein